DRDQRGAPVEVGAVEIAAGHVAALAAGLPGIADAQDRAVRECEPQRVACQRDGLDGPPGCCVDRCDSLGIAAEHVEHDAHAEPAHDRAPAASSMTCSTFAAPVSLSPTRFRRAAT